MGWKYKHFAKPFFLMVNMKKPVLFENNFQKYE